MKELQVRSRGGYLFALLPLLLGSVAQCAEPTQLAFVTQPQGAAAGQPFGTQPIVEVRDASGTPVTDYAGSVSLAIQEGTGSADAQLLGTTTAPVTNGRAAFSGIGIDRKGVGFVLVATADTLAPATSDPFNVPLVGQVPIYKAVSPITTEDHTLTYYEWALAPPIPLGSAEQDVIPGRWTGPADYTATARFLWDASALYFALEVTDDILSFPDTAPSDLFSRDGLELYLGLASPWNPDQTEYQSPGDYQIMLSADVKPYGMLDPRWYSNQIPGLPSPTSVYPSYLNVMKTQTGYMIEGRIPWNLLPGVTPPVQGQTIGFNLLGKDNDQTIPAEDSAFSLSGLPLAYVNPSRWSSAVLMAAPPLPEKTLVFARQPVQEAVGIPFARQPIVEVRAAGWVVLDYTGPVTLTLTGGTAGASLLGTTTATAIRGRAVFQDLAIDTPGTGYELVASIPEAPAPAASQPFDVTTDVPATVIRVRPDGDDANDGSTWPLAKKTVQAAIDAAPPTVTEVWVAGGTYQGHITHQSGVSLYGGFQGTETSRDERDARAHRTVLDGQNKLSVITIGPGSTHGTVIDGFTIMGGDAGFYHPDRGGGGVECVDASPRIEHNVIGGNTTGQSDARGGGIFVLRGSPWIRWNTIIWNIVAFSWVGHPSGIGGGIYSSNASPVIDSNIITDNYAIEAGGLGIFGGAPRITNNLIGWNGLAGFDHSTVGYGGGLLCTSDDALICNNTIVGNIAAHENEDGISGHGGGLSCSSKARVFNNIIAYNTAAISGGGLVVSETENVSNNCFYGNTPDDCSVPITGPGNIYLDPRMVDWAAGDVHLKAGSPCIDAGDDAAAAGIAEDIDGQPRIQGAHVDIGADEFTPLQWSDISQILHLISGLEAAGVEDMARFDTDGDGRLDMVDAAWITQRISGLAPTP